MARSAEWDGRGLVHPEEKATVSFPFHLLLRPLPGDRRLGVLGGDVTGELLKIVTSSGSVAGLVRTHSTDVLGGSSSSVRLWCSRLMGDSGSGERSS